MKNNLKLVLIFVVLIVLTNCKSELSLQKFMIEHESEDSIFTLDLGNEILKLSEKFQTKDNQEVVNSIKKANVMALKIDKNNKDKYFAEVTQLREILKQDKYDQLMMAGKGSKGMRVYAVGTEEKLDEVVVFGNDHETGWVIVRILGDNMDPSKIISIINKFKIDQESSTFSQLSDFFNKS